MPKLSAANREAKIGGAVLLVLAALMAVGGVIVTAGGSDPTSETGQLGHPLVVGLLLLAIAALCGVAGWLLRTGRPAGLAAAAVVTVAFVAMDVFRLWRFGKVGVGDALVLGWIAMLLVGARAAARGGANT